MRGIARPGDVVVIAETAVAIAQSRFIPAEFIRPSRLALTLSRRAGALATVSQPESLQLVIDQAGPRRVLWAALAHVLGRLRGKRGAFYEILGEEIAAIDGYTGTLPPYERAIVLGPADPDRVSAELADALGMHVAIVDANDLRKAKALGASPRANRDAVERALRRQPARQRRRADADRRARLARHGPAPAGDAVSDITIDFPWYVLPLYVLAAPGRSGWACSPSR